MIVAQPSSLHSETSYLDSNGKLAIKWLEKQRTQDFGWGEDTAGCITALQLANSSWYNNNNPSAEISVKEMELELILALWK